jgi:hypothetical protein
MSEPVPGKPKRGCLFFGCLGGAACLVIILVAFLIGLYQLKRMLNFYTDAHPVPLPTVQISPAEFEQLRQRIETFQDAVRTGRPTEPLSLTADEINAYIQNEPNLAKAKGKAYLTIEGNRLKSQVSLPLEELGLRLFRGRYLNGTGIFNVGLQKGNLVITPDVIVVKGKPLPGVYMDKIRSQNLAEGLNNNPRVSVALNHLQEIRVTDGKLVLVPKPEQ